MNIIQTAIDQLQHGAQKRIYNEYYRGNHPLIVSLEKLREIFKQSVNFTLNHCGTVIDTVKDRLNVESFTTENQNANDAADAIYKSCRIGLLQDEVHNTALVYGHSFLVVQAGDDGLEAFAHSPAMATVVYDDENPRKKIAGAKWWASGKKTYLNIYTPDQIVKLQSDTMFPSSEKSFYMIEESPNEYGMIPVFEFVLSECRESELKQLIPVQDAINKLYNDMMVSSEFNSFPWRVAITGQDISGLKMSPGNLLQLEPSAGDEQPTSLIQFPKDDLAHYMNLINGLTQQMSSISRIPLFYFQSTAQPPSGDALEILESPLVKKVESLQDRFEVAWSEFAEFALMLQGIQSGAIEVNWTKPETRQESSAAATRKTNKEAGIPITTQLRQEGWTDEELNQLHEDSASEAVSSAGTTAGPKASIAAQTSTRTAAINTAAITTQTKLAQVIQQTADKAVSAIDNASREQVVR